MILEILWLTKTILFVVNAKNPEAPAGGALGTPLHWVPLHQQTDHHHWGKMLTGYYWNCSYEKFCFIRFDWTKNDFIM